MNATMIISLFGYIEQLLPSLSSASAPVIEKAVTFLEAWVPLIVAEYKAMLPVVQSMITTLTDNTSTTAEQIARLRAVSAVIDGDFDAAIDAAEAEDGAADPGKT